MADPRTVSYTAGKGFLFADGQKQAILKAFAQTPAFAVVTELLQWETFEAVKMLIGIPPKESIAIAGVQERIRFCKTFQSRIEQTVERGSNAGKVTSAISVNESDSGRDVPERPQGDLAGDGPGVRKGSEPEGAAETGQERG